MGRLYEKGGRLCRNGHVKEGANLYIDPSGHRICRECSNLRRTESYWKGKEVPFNLSRDFTARERNTWKLVWLGFSNLEIASHEHLSLKYIENILTVLYDKVGLEGQEQSKRIRLMRLYKEPVNANT